MNDAEGPQPRSATAGADRDLALVLRDAWSVLRLTALHEVVSRTIAQLGSIRPGELLGRELSSLDEQGVSDPVDAALKTCSNELRSESGMAKVPGSAQSHDVAHQPDAWRAAFSEALAKYRSTASQMVKAACDAMNKKE